MPHLQFQLVPPTSWCINNEGDEGARRNLKPKILLLNQLIIRICDRNRYPRFLFSVSPHFRFNPISLSSASSCFSKSDQFDAVHIVGDDLIRSL